MTPWIAYVSVIVACVLLGLFLDWAFTQWGIATGKELPSHRRTDPACYHFRRPNRITRWWFNLNRGRTCPVCNNPEKYLP